MPQKQVYFFPFFRFFNACAQRRGCINIESIISDFLVPRYPFLTTFADWTPKEFASHNKLRVDKEIFLRAGKLDDFDSKDLSTDFDWREAGAVARAKDQGFSCRFLWAFSTIGNIESISANFFSKSVVKNGFFGIL